MLPNKSQQEFDTLTEGATVLEEDGWGIKVLRLPNQRILKLFRRKRLFSSQLWAPHALRFQKNAETLLAKGIPTIEIEAAFSLPHINRQAVLYHELPGITLRQWLRDHEAAETKPLVEQFGRFVAKLHDEGVLFRSLHFGNVLVTPDQTLALIDIVDMSFRSRGSLTTPQRIRNFAHIGRYEEDHALFTQSGEETFIAAYLEASKGSTDVQNQLKQAFLEGLHA